MYIKVYCKNFELGNKYRLYFLKSSKESLYGIQSHISPGNLDRVTCRVDDTISDDDIVVKYYNNSVFSDGEVPKLAQEKDDKWWKSLGSEYVPQVVYDSSTTDDLLSEDEVYKLLIPIGEKEKETYWDTDNDDTTDAWKEDNADMSEFV